MMIIWRFYRSVDLISQARMGEVRHQLRHDERQLPTSAPI